LRVAGDYQHPDSIKSNAKGVEMSQGAVKAEIGPFSPQMPVLLVAIPNHCNDRIANHVCSSYEVAHG
jgi:hypothetical protein